MKKRKGTIGIIGLGKFGLYLTNELSKSDKSIICIDKDENKVKKALSIADIAYVSEDLSVKTLEETGFKECDIIVICISEHLDTAIFATLNALSLGVNRVIAISNSEEQGIVLEKLGAEVIYPYKDSVNWLVKKILNTKFLDFFALNDSVEIVEIKIPSRYVGTTLIDSDIRQKYGINIIAVENKGNITTNIDPKYQFEENDAIIIIGDKKNLEEFQLD